MTYLEGKSQAAPCLAEHCAPITLDSVSVKRGALPRSADCPVSNQSVWRIVSCQTTKPYSLSDPVSSDIWALRGSRLIPVYLYWIFKIRGSIS